MTKLILIRGLPGSGKTTLAKNYVYHSTNKIHLEADMYFMDKGIYRFNKELLHKAHKWCLDTTNVCINNGYDVIVSNTFTTLKEINPYLNLLPKEDIIIVQKLGSFGSIHNVPDSIIQAMKNRWENLSDNYNTLTFYD